MLNCALQQNSTNNKKCMITEPQLSSNSVRGVVKLVQQKMETETLVTANIFT